MVETASQYQVQPVVKALKVLSVLAEGRQPMKLTEVCYKVRLPKTTVFRYLQTLCSCGFVAHDSVRDTYQLGYRLIELGQLAGEQLQIRDVAMPVMHELRAKFNETVNLGILDGQDIVYLEMAESFHSLRMQSTLGSRDPAYATALGKAMLAFIPAQEWDRHVPLQLLPRTRKTLINKGALRANLEVVQRQGYAVDDQENEEGARCIGAPIFDRWGKVQAAVSVSAPSSRLPIAMVTEVAGAVVAAARAISRKLGHPGAQ
jgi:DNA-binding IclR family transcriptional regulator